MVPSAALRVAPGEPMLKMTGLEFWRRLSFISVENPLCANGDCPAGLKPMPYFRPVTVRSSPSFWMNSPKSASCAAVMNSSP